MRDAISILERCTGEDKGLIDEDYVRDLVGIPKLTQIHEIVKGILEFNIESSLPIVNEVIDEGRDLDNFLWEIIKYIKDLLVYKSTNNLELYNEQEKEQINNITKNISKEKILNLIYDLSKLANEIKWSTQKTIMFQAGIISACMEEEKEKTVKEITQSDSKAVIKQAENKVVEKAKNEIQPVPKAQVPKVEKTAIKLEENTKKEKTPYWNNVINKLKENGNMVVYVNLMGSTAKEVNDMVVEVILNNKNAFAKQMLENHDNKAQIEKYISQEFGKPMNVRFTTEVEKNKQTGIENIANDLDIPINIIDG